MIRNVATKMYMNEQEWYLLVKEHIAFGDKN